MCHPGLGDPGYPGYVAGDTRQEWIELCNNGISAVDLNNWVLKKAVSYTFPDVTLHAGAYLVVAADVPTFGAHYPAVTNVIGGWTGKLGDSGDDIRLEDASGQMVDEVPYQTNGDWAQRRQDDTYPGQPNSVAATNIAPMILNVQNAPIIPKPADTVTVAARLLDELTTGVTAQVYYRVDGAPAFTSLPMYDDGQHGDGAAGDGVFGATLPAQPDRVSPWT